MFQIRRLYDIMIVMVMVSEKVVVKDEVLEAGVDNFGFEHVKL